MQARRRRGHRTFIGGKNGLITFGIRSFILAGNVGRQRDMTVTALQTVRLRRVETDTERTVIVAAFHFKSIAVCIERSIIVEQNGTSAG